MRLVMVATHPFADRGRSICPKGVPFVDVESSDLFGASFDPDGRLVMSILPGFHGGQTHQAVARPFWRKLRSIFPQLPKEVQWPFVWYGDLCITGDKFFKLFDPAAGLYVALGYAGNGITQATAMGKEVARLLDDPDSRDAAVSISVPEPIKMRGLRERLLNHVLMPLGREYLYP